MGILERRLPRFSYLRKSKPFSHPHLSVSPSVYLFLLPLLPVLLISILLISPLSLYLLPLLPVLFISILLISFSLSLSVISLSLTLHCTCSNAFPCRLSQLRLPPPAPSFSHCLFISVCLSVPALSSLLSSYHLLHGLLCYLAVPAIPPCHFVVLV